MHAPPPFWQQLLGSITGPVVGFVSAWVLFELTERRKVRLAKKELRQALVAELEHAEVLLGTIIAKHARFASSSAEVAAVAREIRWFENVGRVRSRDSGVLPPELATTAAIDSFDTLTNEQLVTLFASGDPHDIADTKLIFPVLESILAGRVAGFRANELQALSTIKWQAYLLEQYSESSRQFFAMTFTVADASNHAKVVANREASLRAYAERAAVLQRCVRSGLSTLSPGHRES